LQAHPASAAQDFTECPGNENALTRSPITIYDTLILGGIMHRVPRTTEALVDVLSAALARESAPARSASDDEEMRRHDEEMRRDLSVLLEMVAMRDGGTFTQRIVQPIFVCLAYEIDFKGGAHREIALRLGYDDVNESFVDVGNVKAIMREVMKTPTDATQCAALL
jgi:hypothetical protein